MRRDEIQTADAPVCHFRGDRETVAAHASHLPGQVQLRGDASVEIRGYLRLQRRVIGLRRIYTHGHEVVRRASRNGNADRHMVRERGSDDDRTLRVRL